MNIQHLESLNDQVWHITGIRVRETIPDWVVQQADEVVMIDLTPRALLHRLERGVVTAGKSRTRQTKLLPRIHSGRAAGAALRQAAHEVEHRMSDERQARNQAAARARTHISQDPGLCDARSADGHAHPPRQTRERFPGRGVFCRGGPGGRRSERRAREATGMRSSSISISRAICISRPGFWKEKTRPPHWLISRAGIRSRRSFLRNRRIAIGSHSRAIWFRGSVASAKDMQIVIVSEREVIGGAGRNRTDG